MNTTQPTPIKTKFNSAVNSTGRYFKNAIILQQQAYCLGKRDTLTQLAEFMMTQTNGNPTNIPIEKVLEYLEHKNQQLHSDLNPPVNLSQLTINSNKSSPNMKEEINPNFSNKGQNLSSNSNNMPQNQQISMGIEDNRIIEEHKILTPTNNEGSYNNQAVYYPNNYPSTS